MLISIFESRKRYLKFLSGVLRGEREIESSYLSRIKKKFRNQLLIFLTRSRLSSIMAVPGVCYRTSPKIASLPGRLSVKDSRTKGVVAKKLRETRM